MKEFATTAVLLMLTLVSIAQGAEQQAKPEAPSAPTQRADAKAHGKGSGSKCPKREEFSQALEEDNEFVRSLPLLSRAVLAGDIGRVRDLLNRGANVNEKGPIGITALMLAAAAGRLDVVNVLLGAGADPNAWGGFHHGAIFSVLIMAMNRCNENWPEVMSTLIAAGAKINPPAGPAPLNHAIGQSRDPVLIKALLERGADVNLHDGAPLTAAVCDGEPDVEIVKALLAAGADPNLPRVNVGDEKMSLLAYLEQYIEGSRDAQRDKTDEAREEIVRLLKKAGAER